jgi:3-oxoacyl-[acyl-carrier-protein] synthase-3
VVDYTDRSTCVLFGDGAGAAILESTDEPIGLLASELGVDGDAARYLCVPEFGTGAPRSGSNPRRAGIYMEGPEVFRRAVTKMGEASEKVISEAGWSIDDVDLLIPHQANLRIIDATSRKLGLPSSRVFVNVHAYGNTSAATVPVALAEAVEARRFGPYANLVFAAFGGGLTWAAAAVKWGERIEPIRESEMHLPATDETVWDLLAPNLEFFEHEGVNA